MEHISVGVDINISYQTSKSTPSAVLNPPEPYKATADRVHHLQHIHNMKLIYYKEKNIM